MLVAMVRSGPRSGTESQRFGFPSERTVRPRWPLGGIERSSGPFEGVERPEGQMAIVEGWAQQVASPNEASENGRDAAGGSGDPEGRRSESRPTLPRHLHRAVLRLLRPAEAAARRLIVVAARDIVVILPPARPRRPRPETVVPLLRRLGIAVSPSAVRQAAVTSPARPRTAPSLPLVDPIRLPGRGRPVPSHKAPRISFPGATDRRALPQPPAPDDPLDATRLGRRLRALADALDDLPKHAHRFARWRARRDRAVTTGRVRRLSPLRPGRPPGARRGSTREVHEVLADLQWFAQQALARPDTS
ncbi:hypothetical protein [Neoaquamicrobium sediminum]|uniref:hypothetical protein n=1 Tax=Neoaquamicrobium sediminum TaxID=1849104 RepID=UPI003BA9DEF8